MGYVKIPVLEKKKIILLKKYTYTYYYLNFMSN